MSTTVTQLVQYYVNLLIIQYFNAPKASATIAADVTPVIMPQVSVQNIIFTPNPDHGTFILTYDGAASSSINWDDTAAQIQTKLRAITVIVNSQATFPLSQVTVTGSITTTITVTFKGVIGTALPLLVSFTSLGQGILATFITIKYSNAYELIFSSIPTSGTYSFSFNGVASGILIPFNATAVQVQANIIANFPQLNGVVSVYGNNIEGFLIYNVTNILLIDTNTLLNSGNPVTLTFTATDEPLPLAVEDGFRLNFAIGKQLDIIGKYIGVSRTSNTSIGNITLKDPDYLTFLKFAIVQNNSGSSMADIEFNMNLIFAGQYLIFDYKSMNMSYVLSTTLGSAQFFAVLLTEQLLPRPMAVGVSVIIAKVVTNFFGFRTYDAPNLTAQPFNNYNTFDTTWIFLSYANAYFL